MRRDEGAVSPASLQLMVQLNPISRCTGRGCPSPMWLYWLTQTPAGTLRNCWWKIGSDQTLSVMLAVQSLISPEPSMSGIQSMVTIQEATAGMKDTIVPKVLRARPTLYRDSSCARLLMISP